MTGFKVEIGINPIGWSNDDLPSLGGDTPLETILSEGSAIGFTGFELGNKFPKEPLALKEKLAEYGVTCVSGWYSGHLAKDTLENEMQRCRSHMEKLQFNSCKVVVYGEVAGSVQGEQHTPVAHRPQFASDAEWAAYAAKLNAFASFLRTEFGLTLAYHHHMGAFVESPADIDKLMALTEPQVGLLFDSGHAYFGGADDPTAVLQKHIGRVVHVHCKNVRKAVIHQARNEKWSFLHSVLNGAFTVPGDGDATAGLDFKPIIATLKAAGYQGWLVVEAEQDPALAPPRAYSELGYKTLHDLVNA